MRWLARAFASAMARRIAYLLVAASLAWCGISETRAQNTQRCAYPAGGWAQCDEGQAFAECSSGLARAKSAIAGNPNGVIRDACAKTVIGTRQMFQCSYKTYAAGSFAPCPGHSSITSGYTADKKCDARPNWNGPYANAPGFSPKNGSVSCNDGCRQAWFSTGDGYFHGKFDSVPGTCNDYDDQKCKADFGGDYFYNHRMQACEPKEGECEGGAKPNSLGQCAPEPCPDGMIEQGDGTCKEKESECPAGNIKSPDGRCLPGEGQCAEGEVKGPDGTCKRDTDGDGEPDAPGEGDASSFSGGDSCDSPPACSGDAIMCGQARIQWRIDCNTRKNRNIAGGSCSAMPVCTGEKCDALEYSQLIMQWRSSCALEKLASGGNPGGGENADLSAIRNALTGTGGNPDPGQSNPGTGAWVDGGNGTEPVQPDVGGYGWGGSCPQPPSIDVMGSSIQFNIQPLCDWLSLGSFFVMGLAALGSLRIVAGKEA